MQENVLLPKQFAFSFVKEATFQYLLQGFTPVIAKVSLFCCHVMYVLATVSAENYKDFDGQQFYLILG